MIKNNNKNSGQILVISLVVASVLLILSTGLMTISSIEHSYTTKSYKNTQAINLAEAGLEKAIYELTLNTNYTGTLGTPLTLSPGQIEITVSGTGDSRTIEATGYIPTKTNFKSKKIVRVKLGRTPEQVDTTVFNYTAQGGGGGITMGNNSSINFQTYSGASITGKNGSTITGNASASGTITGVTVTGTTSQNQPVIPLPTMNYQYWRDLAAAGGTLNGNQTLSGTTSIGPKKIQGNLTISVNSTISITGTVYVTGNLVVNNGVTINASAGLGSTGTVFLVDGTITFNNNIDVNPNNANPKGYILFVTPNSSASALVINNNSSLGPIFVPNGNAQISNNATDTCVIAKTINMSNNSSISFNMDFLGLSYEGLTNTVPAGLFNSSAGTWQEIK